MTVPAKHPRLLPPGPELDAAVEARVFRRDVVDVNGLWKRTTVNSPGVNEPFGEIPRYSTSNKAADEVLKQVERLLGERDLKVFVDEKLDGICVRIGGPKGPSAEAATRPLAICRVALTVAESLERSGAV